jgi:glycosyltransferase involved in cell wall biosynthesis
LEWGGAQVLFFGLMKEAKNFGEVVAIMPAGSNKQLLKFLDNLKVRYEFVDSHLDAKPALTLKRKLERHWNKFFDELSFIRYLNKLDLKNNVVHTEFAPWQSFILLRWLCSKTQVFVTMHNSLPPVPRWRYFQWRIKFWLLTRSKNFHIFTANKDTKENLRMLVPPASFDKIKVIYANINPEEVEEALTDKLNRAEICRKYNLPKDKFMVFCVGQFIDRKGRWIFLGAAKKLLQKNHDIAFVWISNSKPSAEDLKKAESYGLGENFTLITSDQVGTEHIDLFKLMRLADVFALPSYLEGLPISIIEAMALGIPTISTDINAIPEAVKHLETGLLIEPGNSEALTNAVELLKSDANLRKKLSENGREYVLEKFNEKVVAKIAVENYIAALRYESE